MQMCFWCFLGAVAESVVPPLVWIWGIKTYSSFALCFFGSCQINIAQGDFWFSPFFSCKTGETKPGFLCGGFDVRCKLQWQGPGPVCGNNASVQRVTQMLTALLFLEIQNRTAEHTEHTLVTWNLRWRALIKLNHKQQPARLSSLLSLLSV